MILSLHMPFLDSNQKRNRDKNFLVGHLHSPINISHILSIYLSPSFNINFRHRITFSIISFAGWTPYSIVTLIKLLYPRPPDNLSNPYVEPMLLTLALLNSCINPFVHSYHIFFDYFKSLKKERKGNPNESPTVLGRSRSVRETHV